MRQNKQKLCIIFLTGCLSVMAMAPKNLGQLTESHDLAKNASPVPFKNLSDLQHMNPFAVEEESHLKTYRYGFLYGKAETFIADIKHIFPQSFFVVDKTTNAIIVQTIPSRWKKIKTTLKLLDKKQKQVQIKVKIIETSDEAFSSINPSFSNILSKKQVDTTSELWNGWIDGTIDLLIKNGKANLLAEPTLLVLDNNTAKLSFGDDIPYATTTWLNNSIVRNLSYVKTGVTLEVTPRITKSNILQLNTSVTITNAKTWREDGDQQFPVVSNRRSESTVYVEDGKPVVLAGMFEKNEKKNVQAIPLISDIPFLGELFKQTKTEHTTSEIVVILSPTILD